MRDAGKRKTGQTDAWSPRTTRQIKDGRDVRRNRADFPQTDKRRCTTSSSFVNHKGDDQKENVT